MGASHVRGGSGTGGEHGVRISTAIIGVPTGMKIFNWMATMYKGDLRLQSPMLFCIGGVHDVRDGRPLRCHALVVPSDYQQTDTYYIVAHFHYVIFGGGVFVLFGGLVYWWPKVFARMFPERTAKLVFWIMLVGFNLTFGPMHVLGLGGMIRRTYTYPAALGLTLWNEVATVGAFMIRPLGRGSSRSRRSPRSASPRGSRTRTRGMRAHSSG